jgi:tight adherence protein C
MMSPLVFAAGAIFLVFSTGVGMILLRQLRQERLFALRVALVHGEKPSAAENTDSTVLRDWLTRAVTSLGKSILRSGLLRGRSLSDLERTLASSGFHGQNGLGLFIGIKILLVVGLPVITVLALDGVELPNRMHIILPAVAAVLGLLAPDWVVGKRRKSVMAQLEQGLPDALDMMVICAQAGLGLGPAIIRVGTELAYARPEIAREFLLTADDLQIMSDSRVALGNLGARTGLDSIKRLVTALIQTVVYGTPLTDALRMLSLEMRQEILTRFEARAARLPVLLTLPTVVFILPCVFLIVGGPAGIQVMNAFSHQNEVVKTIGDTTTQ